MRIRTIKPGFFTHEIIAEMSPLARLLFISLWCMADVAGRLEDRPKRIKIEALPYEECDIQALLEEIRAKGFIDRYQVDGVRIIQVVNFEKHQRISGKESQTTSELPEKQLGSTCEAPEKHPGAQEGKGREEERQGETERGSSRKRSRGRFSEDEFDSLLSPAMRANPEFLQAWHRWCAYRHARGKRISEAAAKEQIKTLHAAGTQASIAAIAKSIANDWQGLFLENGPKAPAAAPAPAVLTFEQVAANFPEPNFGDLPGLYDYDDNEPGHE